MTSVIEKEKKEKIENKETTPIFLNMEMKKIIEDFIELYIVQKPLCSEKFNEVYDLYTKFLKEKNQSIEILKKRSFKLALKIILESKGWNITPIPTNLGVLLVRIGIEKNPNNKN